MRYQLVQAALAGYASLALAAPSGKDMKLHKRGPGDFSLPAIRTRNASLETRQTAPADPQTHYTTAKIGGQLLPIFVDTGSSIFWCYNTKLPSDQLGNHKPYDPDASTTDNPTDQTYEIGYVDGTGSSGPVIKEDVDCASTVNQQFEIGIPDTITGAYQDSLSCLMGLSYNANPPENSYSTTWFDAVRPQLSNPLFTVDIDDAREGSFNFGFIDDSLYTGDIQYAAVTDDVSWQFQMTGYSVGDGDVQPSSDKVIADTGTGGISLDSDLVSNYFSGVDGATNNDGWKVPCDAQLPDLHVKFDGGEVVIAGAKIMGGDDGTGTCGVGIDGNGAGILGDVMFRTNFVVFDQAPRVGFAQKANMDGT